MLPNGRPHKTATPSSAMLVGADATLPDCGQQTGMMLND